ncbi:MAG TPA: S41 family peptidase [Candidatus Saccharimonadales bacterium]|nr:S41 family peptidase [Candidatus Saccharimonadales bacterium]
MMKQPLLATAGLALVLLAAPVPARSATNLLPRFPTLHGDTIVFEAAGNLWSVSRDGGTARRLTADPGFDMMPRFSPDGKWIAFTGQYEGNTDVYVIPAEGGTARRLTYHSDVVQDAPMRWGPDNMVVTWTPDGKGVVFLSRRDTFNDWFGRLFVVPLGGGLPVALPLPAGGVTSYGPGGTKIAYNRIFRNFRTWKNYYGGLAQDLWIYDLGSHDIQRVTDWKGTDTHPMWHGDTIYFASDRGSEERLNIWAYSLTTKQFRQVTHFTDYEVDWPSLGDTGIVFQDGGSLYVLDLPSEKVHELDVTVPSDGLLTRPRWADASEEIESYNIAPNGKRAVFEARGDLFTVPAEHGNTRNLTRTVGAREQFPAWSPDGKWVAYVTDDSGEEQVAMRPSDGTGEETQLTKTEGHYYYEPRWAPDSDKLAFSDNTHTLWYLTVKDRKPVRVAQDLYNEIHDYRWSPDGLWLAYSIQDTNSQHGVYLYSLGDGKATRLTTAMDADFSPAFGPKGKLLFFLSGRHENAAFSESEFNIATLKMTGIYVTTLQKETPSPFAPRSDEGSLDSGKKDEKKEGEKEKEPKAGTKEGEPGAIAAISVDLEGLSDRVVPVPVEPARYRSLVASGDRLFYMTYPVQDIDGPLPGEKPALHSYDLDKRKEATLAENAGSFELSADGKKILYSSRGGGRPSYHIIDAEGGGKGDEHGEPLDLSGMKVQISPSDEWDEMFHQAWRLERDFFFNEKMNGKDWEGMRGRYEKLLGSLGCREDLNYVLGEMVAELQNSHTYVGGGDQGPRPDAVRTGVLGVDFRLDEASGRYVIERIYHGDNSRPEMRSPLTEPGLDARQGDFLLAVDGRDVRAPDNPYSFFLNTMGRTVTLDLASDASGKDRRQVTAKPIHDEMALRLHDWIAHNRETVDRESGGKIGYIYLSDMSEEGMNQFIRQFYPQLDKQGMIVDVRWNGGGFIDQIVLERLRRVLVGMETNRERVSGPIPNQVMHGYMVCLDNHYSASDGDIFPFYFKKYELGPIIGTRTWGGVRGIRGYWPLLDGGYVTVPEDSLYGLDSQWVMENHGVEPDIEVDNLPGDVVAGKDAQLEAGIKYILDKLAKNPKTLPGPPPLQPAYPPAGHD